MKFNNWTLQDLIKYLNSLPSAGPSYFDYTKKIYVSGEIHCEIVDRYSHIDANVARYQKRYESLTYQYENNFYNNNNDVGKYELVSQIEHWNTDLAYYKTIQRNFWVGIYYPNIYDQFEFIELDKEVNGK